jgi:hypothetical protein
VINSKQQQVFFFFFGWAMIKGTGTTGTTGTKWACGVPVVPVPFIIVVFNSFLY